MFKETVIAKYAIEAGDVLYPKFNTKKLEKQLQTTVDSKEAKDLLKHITKQDIAWIDPEILKSLVKRFDNNKDVLDLLKTLMSGTSENPYHGKDVHDIVWGKDAKEKRKSPFPLPAKVGDIKGVLGKDVPLGSGEPLMWMDSKYKISKNLIKENQYKQLTINTRSDLISHDDYMEVLNPSLHKINIHISSLNDAFNRLTEPGAPSALRRIGAAAKLKIAKYNVSIVHDVFDNHNASPELVWFNTVTTQGVNRLASRYASVSIKLKENKVKLTDEQIKNLNDLAIQLKNKAA